MLSLFKTEVEQQSVVLVDALLVLQDGLSTVPLEAAIKSVHAIKGAARLVGMNAIAQLCGAMEECFSDANNKNYFLSHDAINTLSDSVMMIASMAQMAEDMAVWQFENGVQFDQQLSAVKEIFKDTDVVHDFKIEQKEQIYDPVKKNKEGASKSLQDMSMVELFRVEADQQSAVLSEGLLELEQDPSSAERLESLMRAAHSIKGAARLVDIQFVVQLAHVMEDVFVMAQKGVLLLTANQIDVLLNSVDAIVEISSFGGNLDQWMESSKQRFDTLIINMNAILTGDKLVSIPDKGGNTTEKTVLVAPELLSANQFDNAVSMETNIVEKKQASQKERVLRVSADQLNRLMGLAGESLVESRWVYPYAESLLRLKRQQTELVCLIDTLREQLDIGSASDVVLALVRSAQKQASYCREILADRLTDLESYDRRTTNLSSRLHHEVVKSRMRPFGDGIHGFPRMVRDIAKSLGKEVQFIVDGSSTMVDRDILDKIESPLNHLIRNAIDHGLELADERIANGKPAKGTIRLHAYHHAGMLSLVVGDDGRGVNIERLRQKISEKGLVDKSMADTLSEAELLEFLFLPSFSTRDQVSEISGRGVGLDVVHDVVQEMRGNVRAISEFGKGTKFHMQLPLTLSVIPALIVEISEEPYAFPLARIDKIVRVSPSSIEEAEGNQFVRIGNKNIGLVNAAQILEREPLCEHDGDDLSVIVLSERNSHYGMVVDKFLGERDLVVQVMPSVLGKVQDISSAALMEDGSPVLIVDVDDLIRSIDKVLKMMRLNKIKNPDEVVSVLKRVLVVDDSITVREVERKLLEWSGYQVDTAVDGMDGLNMLRGGDYDLLITDVDMPRMNGIELVKAVRQDPSLRGLPVMMVSYKDREEDKMRGLEAGADYYLAKGSFHDDSLRQAVIDLIGESRA